MALQGTAQKAYVRYGSDAEKTYKARRFSIRQRLPHMTASQLQKAKQELDWDLEMLHTEIHEIRDAIRSVRQEKDPESARRKYRVNWSLSMRKNDVIEQFQTEIKWRKQIASWIRRERQIYMFELMKRKLKGAKLPMLKLEQARLLKREAELQVEVAEAQAKLKMLREDHQKIQQKRAHVEQEISYLSV